MGAEQRGAFPPSAPCGELRRVWATHQILIGFPPAPHKQREDQPLARVPPGPAGFLFLPWHVSFVGQRGSIIEAGA